MKLITAALYFALASLCSLHETQGELTASTDKRKESKLEDWTKMRLAAGIFKWPNPLFPPLTRAILSSTNVNTHHASTQQQHHGNTEAKHAL